MDKIGMRKPNHKLKPNVEVTIIYKEGEETINENQQYQNGTNADESETDSPTA